MQSKKYPYHLKEDIQSKIISWFHLPGSQATSKEAKKINERIRNLVDLVYCVADEVWIKVVKVSKKWTYSFLSYSPKSLFIYALDYLTHRDEVTMGLKVMECQERGFCPRIFTSDLLKVYRSLAGYFKGCLHQLCTNHGIKTMYKILRDLPPEAKQNKLFYDYMVKVKERFVALFKLDDIVKIEGEIKQIKKELSLFQGEMRKFAKPMLRLYQPKLAESFSLQEVSR